MVIKVKKDWKDLVEFSDSHGVSRRDLLKWGLATGTLSVALPQIVADGFIKQAMAADAMNCPPPLLNKGALAQIFAEGGPTMGARWISDAQAAQMNANMAKNYGITGQANLVKLGPNMNIDRTSAFGFTLMQGPPGYTGGAAAWQANVLSKVSGGGHLGPFNQDDGAGQDSGLVAGASPFKVSQMGKDLKINVSNTLASWANGLPSASVTGGATVAKLASTFSMNPAANGLTNKDAMTASANTANFLAKAMASVFKTADRKGGDIMMKNAGCAFYGNSALADPNYGTQLFTPTNITALTSKFTVGQLTQQEQAHTAAYYQSAMGVAGGVIIQFNGRDYHTGDASQSTPADIEEARSIVMFLAACEAAQARGSLIYFSNGQAIGGGVTASTQTINGVASQVNGPIAVGDAGGSYNAGLILFYDPAGPVTTTRFTGTTDANGNATTDSNVGSSEEAVAGLYLSAIKFINNSSIPQEALKKMTAAGVAANPNNILVI